MDEVIRSVLVECRLLSGSFDHLARLWRFVLAFTPYTLFLCETIGDTLAEPAYTYQGHDQSWKLLHAALVLILLARLII